MAYYVAGAIIFSAAYTANEARKSRESAEDQARQALAQQQADAARMQTELANQTAAYRQQAASLESQATIAKQQFDAQQLKYKEDKLAMDQKAAEVQAAADEERRKAAAGEASALRARTRGGRRSLLSDQRMDSELGLGMSLGGGTGLQ